VNNEENKESIRQIYFSVLFPQTDGGDTATIVTSGLSIQWKWLNTNL
jgi:hypothetical protein